jgi:hypothetical protein
MKPLGKSDVANTSERIAELEESLELNRTMPDLDITVHSSPQEGEIEPDPAYRPTAVLSAQPML